MKRRKWVLGIVLVLILAAGAGLTLWHYAVEGSGIDPHLPVFANGKIWDDGLVPLSVTIRSTSGSMIGSASGESFGDTYSAEYALENLAPPDTKTHAASENPFIGIPLAVPVPISTKIYGSMFWNYSRRYQYSKIVVIVVYQDGRREGRMIDIPDLRKCLTVLVDFP